MENPCYESEANAYCLVCLPCLVTPDVAFDAFLPALIGEGGAPGA
jgi:hypothetical protein